MKYEKNSRFLLCSALLISNCMSAKADHMNGSSPCSNQYFTMQETGIRGTYTGTHNYTCTVTYYIKSHNKYCSSCGAYVGGIYLCMHRDAYLWKYY